MIERQLAISPKVEQGKFEVCDKRGDQFFIRFTGDLDGLADCLFGLGISVSLQRQDKEIYLILNEDDYKKITGCEDPDYEAQ